MSKIRPIVTGLILLITFCNTVTDGVTGVVGGGDVGAWLDTKGWVSVALVKGASYGS
jgi:hypothetical protein